MENELIAKLVNTKIVGSVNIKGSAEYDPSTRVTTFSDGSKATQFQGNDNKYWIMVSR